MAGHGLSIHKFANGDVGLCTGVSKFPLFTRPNIADMVEVLRQLSNQAVQMQNQSQWDNDPAA